MPRQPPTPSSRYHSRRDRSPEARNAHADASKRWRRDLARAAFTDADQDALLAAITHGARLRDAAADLGLSYQAVYKRAEWDTRFGQRLEEVLAHTCPAGIHCGTPTGARFHHGHCHACRTAHHPIAPRK
ncbi:hypothetical protein [Nocardia sp. NPDC052566]|uniref:hypothetical protein n=1 Tax=Nocardia sp. NPDC052566 TaxID=3364330 RepID=UPI0037C65F1E